MLYSEEKKGKEGVKIRIPKFGAKQIKKRTVREVFCIAGGREKRRKPKRLLLLPSRWKGEKECISCAQGGFLIL